MTDPLTILACVCMAATIVLGFCLAAIVISDWRNNRGEPGE